MIFHPVRLFHPVCLFEFQKLSACMPNPSYMYAIFHVPILIFAVMSEGLPSPNSTCNALFPGRTGHPKGTIQAPGDSDIFHRLEGPLTCTKSLVPSDSQSLTLTVNPPLFVSILLSWYKRECCGDAL